MLFALYRSNCSTKYRTASIPETARITAAVKSKVISGRRSRSPRTDQDREYPKANIVDTLASRGHVQDCVDDRKKRKQDGQPDRAGSGSARVLPSLKQPLCMQVRQ